MGWTASPVDSHLPEILYRPHVVMNDIGLSSEQADTARELRFSVWGLKDPQSWQDYQDLKNSRLQFIATLSERYRTRFGMTTNDARLGAEMAWRKWLDGIIYARSPDSYQLTRLARFDAPPVLGPESSPREIAAAATSRLIASGHERSVEPTGSSAVEVWTQGLLAAVYTGQSEDMIDSLVAELEFALRVKATSTRTGQQSRDLRDMRRRAYSRVLLAAWDNRNLMEKFLALGADPNFETNWFQKTPLMYAAQHDALAAIEFLLSNDAELDAATDASGVPCGRLERDHRTALMYAAENASADVILALVNAGANLLIQDTMGNRARWYLDRNTRIADEAVRLQLEGLLEVPN